jgi:DNA/RNA-binding domain of Phe-tRNA-synthetase-like protein
MTDLFMATPAWNSAHPGAACGVLAMRGVANPPSVPDLDREKAALERELRERFGGLDRAALREVGLLPAYAAYYKRWGQRYHVGMQVESIAQKGKEIPRVAALVEAMFVAELRTQVLTAGHDLDALLPPVRMDVGAGEERYQTPHGAESAVKPGDMYVDDARSVLSSIIAGPADYARITPQTTAVLFAAYGVPGVPAAVVEAHLAEIERLVRLVSPAAETVLRRVVVGGEEARS